MRSEQILIAAFFARRNDPIKTCGMLEAIEMCEQISGKKLNWSYEETNRIGDHIWWISDVRKFQAHYPNWKFRYGMRNILEEIHGALTE